MSVVMVSLAERRILYVDDRGDDCELFSIFLTQAGYLVELAQSVKEAVQLLITHQFHLCLSDISLPDGTGFELIQKIQGVDPLMPIIIFSADARSSTRTAVMEAGALAFFTKPIDYDLLVETITQLLQLRIKD